MALRTEIIDGELHYTPKTVYADAMYAHALVQAIGEYEKGPYLTLLTPKFIWSRAAEIMRGFGYTEDGNGSG